MTTDQDTINSAASFWQGFLADVADLLNRIKSLPAPAPALDFSALNAQIAAATSLAAQVTGFDPAPVSVPTVPVASMSATAPPETP